MEHAYKRLKEELEMQQLQYFQVRCSQLSPGKRCLLIILQVFRAYRESYEEQKVALEQRFRGLLEESLEDAIYLAAVKSELKLQVQDLRQGKIAIILYNDNNVGHWIVYHYFTEVAVLKDTLTKAGVPLPPRKGFNALYQNY